VNAPDYSPVFVKASLLDRLAPSDKASGAPASISATSEGVYQDAVLRDLEWLFNAVSPLENNEEIRRKYPRASASVLGYGLRGILGRVVHDPAEIQERVEAALAAFEPRR